MTMTPEEDWEVEGRLDVVRSYAVERSTPGVYKPHPADALALALGIAGGLLIRWARLLRKTP